MREGPKQRFGLPYGAKRGMKKRKRRERKPRRNKGERKKRMRIKGQGRVE